MTDVVQDFPPLREALWISCPAGLGPLVEVISWLIRWTEPAGVNTPAAGGKASEAGPPPSGPTSKERLGQLIRWNWREEGPRNENEEFTGISASSHRPEYSDPDGQSEQPVVGEERKGGDRERGIKGSMPGEVREEEPPCPGLKISVSMHGSTP